MDLETTVAGLAPRLLAYTLGRTGCYQTAEDIAQEALTALVQRWRRVGPPDSPDAFVFAIAKRRAGRANARRALLAPLELVRLVVAPGPSPEDLHVQRSERAALARGIRELPRLDREVVLLRLAGDLDADTIARIVGTTPAAVKMRLSRARRRLKSMILESGYERRTRTA